MRDAFSLDLYEIYVCVITSCSVVRMVAKNTHTAHCPGHCDMNMLPPDRIVIGVRLWCSTLQIYGEAYRRKRFTRSESKDKSLPNSSQFFVPKFTILRT